MSAADRSARRVIREMQANGEDEIPPTDTHGMSPDEERAALVIEKTALERWLCANRRPKDALVDLTHEVRALWWVRRERAATINARLAEIKEAARLDANFGKLAAKLGSETRRNHLVATGLRKAAEIAATRATVGDAVVAMLAEAARLDAEADKTDGS